MVTSWIYESVLMNHANAISSAPALREQARLVGLLAALTMIGGVFLPWAHLTIRILGVESPPLDFKGSDIGSDIGGIPWGWFMLGAGVVGALAVRNRNTRVAVAAGVGGALFAFVSVATLNASAIGGAVTADGQNVAVLSPHVSPAWGSWVVLIASIVLALTSALSQRAGPSLLSRKQLP